MNPDPKLDLPEKILMFTQKLPSHESLFVIQNYNFELREILNQKQDSLKEIELQKSKEENELKSIEFAIESKTAEIEKVKKLLNEDSEIEKQWKERLKLAEEKKLASIKEYQKKMSECRNKLFSCVDVNDAAISEEIEEISEELKITLQKLEDSKSILSTAVEDFHVIRTSDDENIINNIQIFRNELLNEDEVEKECKSLENEIMKISEQLKML